jgi:hypothetical protein
MWRRTGMLKHRSKVRARVLPCCGQKSNLLSIMLLEPEQPEHSSSAVRTRSIGTDQFVENPAWLSEENSKLRPRPTPGEVTSIGRRPNTVLRGHGFCLARPRHGVLTVHLTFRHFCFCVLIFDQRRGLAGIVLLYGKCESVC